MAEPLNLGMASGAIPYEYPLEEQLKYAKQEIDNLREILHRRDQDIRERCIDRAKVEVPDGAEEQTIGGWISRADALAQYIIHGKEKPE